MSRTSSAEESHAPPPPWGQGWRKGVTIFSRLRISPELFFNGLFLDGRQSQKTGLAPLLVADLRFIVFADRVKNIPDVVPDLLSSRLDLKGVLEGS